MDRGGAYAAVGPEASFGAGKLAVKACSGHGRIGGVSGWGGSWQPPLAPVSNPPFLNLPAFFSPWTYASKTTGVSPRRPICDWAAYFCLPSAGCPITFHPATTASGAASFGMAACYNTTKS